MKRQAMTELQKAVSEAERKAHDMITTERAKMERTVAEAKRQAAEDALAVINQQEDSSEVRQRASKGRRFLPPLRVLVLILGDHRRRRILDFRPTDLWGEIRVIWGALALVELIKDLKEQLCPKGFLIYSVGSR